MAEVGAEFAHELNQPLTALMLYLRAAKTLGSGQVSDRTLPVEAIAILEKAAHEAERLADIIQKIENLAARESPARRLVDVKVLVEDAVDVALQDRKTTAVIRQYDPELPAVLIDPLQIQQILVNLVDDAIEAAAAGNEPLVRASATSVDGGVSIVIERNRTGNDNAGLAAAKTKNGGDLALAICRRIARSHGGELTFGEGQYQAGCRAILRLPVPCS
jgi:two-component system, LuxR family, sensor kinase FixL